MKVGIIGAGFGGLAAGYRLAKNGHDVTIFESEEKPGGLAIGFEQKRWDWSLEAHYHHWFTNDDSVLNLAQEIGHEVITVRPKTSTFIDSKIHQLDSPLSLLKFNKLSLIDRLRTGVILAYLKLTPFWKPLEKVTAKEFLTKTMGMNTWKVLWEPLFIGKFQKYADKITASWFWARIKKRTPSLAYPEGGFLAFAQRLDKEIKENGAKIYYGIKVGNIKKVGDKIVVSAGKEKYEFEKVICTLPSVLFIKLTTGLPKGYINRITDLKGIGAVNLVLSLKKQFLVDGTYWLNINDKDHPYLAVVEHTNFIDKKHYDNEHLLYIGNYLPHDHEYFKRSAKELVNEFMPYLKKINPRFNYSLINRSYIFKAYFAQPIVPLNYSKKVPDFKTPIKGLYLCNIQQVYPWDRGTNYAVENGEKVAQIIINNQ